MSLLREVTLRLGKGKMIVSVAASLKVSSHYQKAKAAVDDTSDERGANQAESALTRVSTERLSKGHELATEQFSRRSKAPAEMQTAQVKRQRSVACAA